MSYTAADLTALGAKWMDRIRAREKEKDMKEWMDDAERAEEIYLCNKDKRDKNEFNILHSNVETIVPSIYNSTPRPDIRPRHGNADPVAKEVSDALERAISAQIDDNRLDTEIEGSAQDVFVAGLGVVRVKFDADDVPAQTAVDPLSGEEIEVAPASLENERVLFEAVSWRDYRYGPCRRFDQRPWEAFRHCISQEDLAEITDGEIADVYAREGGESPVENEELDVDVWEIWTKDKRQVLFVAADRNRVLAIRDDPLGVKGFYSVASPVVPIHAVGKTVPVCPYVVYQKLAEELDVATKRIRGLMKGIKSRALAAGIDAGDLERLAEADDNEIIVAANLENLAATGGIDKAVLWWPIEQSITVLRELYVQREQTKQAIYEITGISDIVRGASKSGETATAQQIKTQWGSLRVKKMQRLIERQVRDLFVLAAEIITRHFSIKTLQEAAGMELSPQAQQALGNLGRYRIDVESDSTVRADLTRNRQDMSEFLQGTAQFFQVVAPIVAQAPKAAGPITDMYAAFARQFNLGKQAEDALEQFVEMAKQASSQPPERQPDPRAEMAKMEMQMKEREFAAKQEEAERKSQYEKVKASLDIMGKKLDFAIKREEFGMDMKRMERQAEIDVMQADIRSNEKGQN
jgi:hypothetical protein